MKAILAGLAAAALAAAAWGGEGWQTDFEAAKKQAAETRRPILADFSGSDWCGWCIKLDREVFATEAFRAYARDNLVLFLADFPRQKEQAPRVKAQNETLQRTYAIRGFPTVLLLDAEGKLLARTGYRPGGPEAYIAHLKTLLPPPGGAPAPAATP